jgi:hypothetical protein
MDTGGLLSIMPQQIVEKRKSCGNFFPQLEARKKNYSA